MISISIPAAEVLLSIAFRATKNHTEVERVAINELANALTAQRLDAFLETNRQKREGTNDANEPTP